MSETKLTFPTKARVATALADGVSIREGITLSEVATEFGFEMTQRSRILLADRLRELGFEAYYVMRDGSRRNEWHRK